jgi:hypothetical protein
LVDPHFRPNDREASSRHQYAKTQKGANPNELLQAQIQKRFDNEWIAQERGQRT